MKNNINFKEFIDSVKNLEIKMGMIVEVERIPKNKKMIKMVVNFGETINKTVISNIGGNMENVTDLLNLSFPFVTNLEPVEMNGFVSEAMILADVDEDTLNLDIRKPGYKIL